jgi:membrane-bound metal-dependent hydrolase YbcI (DUF457 family)
MTRQGHNLTGIALAIAVADAIWRGHPTINGAIPAALAGACALLGATAPDALEIAWFKNGRRKSIIPHRTLTHWPALWIALAVLDDWLIAPRYGRTIGMAIAGYCAGAAIHLLMDIGTPMGIPFGLPTAKHRVSFNLYRSGQAGAELALVLICFGLSILSISLLR